MLFDKQGYEIGRLQGIDTREDSEILASKQQADSYSKWITSLNLYITDMGGYNLDHAMQMLGQELHPNEMLIKAHSEGMTPEDAAIHLISAIDVKIGKTY